MNALKGHVIGLFVYVLKSKLVSARIEVCLRENRSLFFEIKKISG